MIINGDAITVLKTLPDKSVHCCVTSPPYWGLRDYGVDGQLGLEKTPDEYVAKMVEVFREVRRVLRDDGTLWLNLGDSYVANQKGRGSISHITNTYKDQKNDASVEFKKKPSLTGLKTKDLVGIPWRVAFALQQPYYRGLVKDERDRVWLAAMLDAEGSICGTEYQSNGRTKTNIYLTVTNTSAPIIEKCESLFPQDGKHVYEKLGPSNRLCLRWDVERMDRKSLFIREIYPYLVAKRKQAILGYTFTEMQKGLVSKKKGYLSEQQEKRSWLMSALSSLNAGNNIDLPDWVIEPPSLMEPGFYLRQDIIWHKPNPMPESVRDRCTKAHEYIFLMSKSEKYYFDWEAMQEPAVSGANGSQFHTGKTGAHQLGRSQKVRPNELNGSTTRNKRSVWSVATKPFKGAHFATFPPDLIEPCILAGCPEGGTVLDPFFGAGTTGLVAKRTGREYVGIELNQEYIDIAKMRIDTKGFI